MVLKGWVKKLLIKSIELNTEKKLILSTHRNYTMVKICISQDMLQNYYEKTEKKYNVSIGLVKKLVLTLSYEIKCCDTFLRRKFLLHHWFPVFLRLSRNGKRAKFKEKIFIHKQRLLTSFTDKVYRKNLTTNFTRDPWPHFLSLAFYFHC